MMYQILLYYSYTEIADPTALAERQRLLCQRLGLTGRIIFAKEGINGTLEGTNVQTERYIQESAAEAAFASVSYKKSTGTGTAFPKLSVKVRSEIVSAHLEGLDINPAHLTGVYITADELHTWIHSDKEFYIVDMRNDYEHSVGHFAGSILPSMQHFRQLPEVLPLLDSLKGKTIVTVCTGGVRCEKASGFLLSHGFGSVYQLDGGIVTYMERYPGEDFAGALYVFDARVTMAFSGPRMVIGKCERCNSSSETYRNCAYPDCNRHFICCEKCSAKQDTIFCSLACQEMMSTPA